MNNKTKELGFWLWLFTWGTAGTAIGQYLLSTWFCWVGTAVAMTGAYLVYDKQAVVRAVKRAGQQTFQRSAVTQSIAAVSQDVLAWLVIALAVFAFGAIPTLLLGSILCWWVPTDHWFVISNEPVGTAAILVVFCVYNLIIGMELDRQYDVFGRDNWLKAQIVMVALIPVCLFWMPWVMLIMAVALGLIIIAVGCWLGVMLKRVVWLTIKAIHSDARWLYALSAGVGATAGYLLTRNPVMAPGGGLIALFCGALEFKLARHLIPQVETVKFFGWRVW